MRTYVPQVQPKPSILSFVTLPSQTKFGSHRLSNRNCDAVFGVTVHGFDAIPLGNKRSYAYPAGMKLRVNDDVEAFLQAGG